MTKANGPGGHSPLRFFRQDDRSQEQIDAEAAVVGPLAEDLRVLNELSVVSEVDAEAVGRVREHLEAARAILAERTLDVPYGMHFATDVHQRSWGNAAVGLRNPIAPPLECAHDDDGTVHADVFLHRGYEGPPGLTHGGISALILDQVLGYTAAVNGCPGMTGTLTLRYRNPTPLGALHAEARVDRIEGIKAFVVGHISDGETVCVEAEGVFILPRWARERMAAEASAVTEAPAHN
ncbi:PaaI family thioesterase [Tomitella cavernea]|uniref:Acyl-coenzyme A thioesterase THEM4 n=1 Tax=Tomitella cavernea TaxID=1387982 RepID=A0ABP9C2L9_9ACTN|nr:PaaI family thioesterase [Tomitella cavernea]